MCANTLVQVMRSFSKLRASDVGQSVKIPQLYGSLEGIHAVTEFDCY